MSVNWLRKLSRIQTNENGASAVEFAMVFPILLVLIFGIIQFGFIFFHFISITHAAREGARWAALEQTDADVRLKVKASAPGLTLADADIAIDPAGDRSGFVNNPVKVTVQYRSPIIVPFIGEAMGLSGTDITLTSAATQRIE